MMKIVVVPFNDIMTSDKSAIMSWKNNVSYKIHCVAYLYIYIYIYIYISYIIYYI